jgi:hypothetical protein
MKSIQDSLSQLIGRDFVAGTLNHLVENNFDVVVALAGVAVGKVSGNYIQLFLVKLRV